MRRHRLALEGERLATQSYLDFVGAAWMHTLLSITNLLQNTSRLLKVLREEIFLLSDLRKEHTKLVANIADCIVFRALAPFAELACDALTFATCLLVGTDGMIFGLDKCEQAFGKLGLSQASQTADREAVLRLGFVGILASL